MAEMDPAGEPETPAQTDGLDFGVALALIKEGRLLARVGWNGRRMFVFLVPGSTFAVNRPPLLGIYPLGTTVEYHPHIDLRAADGVIAPWHPSQADMLAQDWQVVSP